MSPWTYGRPHARGPSTITPPSSFPTSLLRHGRFIGLCTARMRGAAVATQLQVRPPEVPRPGCVEVWWKLCEQLEARHEHRRAARRFR